MVKKIAQKKIITRFIRKDSGGRGKMANATVVLIMSACLMGPSKQMNSLRRSQR